MSIIRDPALAPAGWVKIRWAEANMPVLARVAAELGHERPLAGVRVAACLHLEAKTARLALALQQGGAELALCASNPLSTQDDVTAALADAGITVYARRGESPQEYERFLHLCLEHRPHLIIDDGADLLTLLHREYASRVSEVLGACEETTTGVTRLRAMAREGRLGLPVIAVNDALTKHLFDNRYGTGQSVWDAVMRTTNLSVAGKCAVVAGYGWCGRGVASRARGLGARVIVCEVDPVRAGEALMEGYEVAPMADAARAGDFFITTTGCRDVVRGEHFQMMKDGAVLANAGHFDVEINLEDLARLGVDRRPARPGVEEFILGDGRKLRLLGEGRLVNLAAGDGHPVEIMDMSFALQALSACHLLAAGKASPLPSGVHSVPQAIDRRVASLFLASRGVAIDILTADQRAYLVGEDTGEEDTG